MLQRKTVVLFDLEDTLIDSWRSGKLLLDKFPKIKEDLNCILHPGAVAGIFSFAVDNVKEGDEAFNMMKDPIKTHFGLDLQKEFIFPFDKICDVLSDETRADMGSLAKFEIANLLGKEFSFQIFTRAFPGIDFILIDDALSGCAVVVRETQLIQTVRVS